MTATTELVATPASHCPPTEIRLLDIGDIFCDDRERVWRKVGILRPDPNNRLGHRHLAVPAGSFHYGALKEFPAHTLVWRLT